MLLEAVCVAGCGVSCSRRIQVDNRAPEILCQTLNSALGTAARGEKCALARAAPSPEFCMPTSMARVLRWARGSLNNLPVR
ncbi:hypothetical protein D3C72_2128130 [compost metagenome]